MLVPVLPNMLLRLLDQVLADELEDGKSKVLNLQRTGVVGRRAFNIFVVSAGNVFATFPGEGPKASGRQSQSCFG